MPTSVQAPLTQALAQRLGPLPTELTAHLTLARCIRLRRGQALLRADQVWQHLWWVESGALRLFYMARDGSEANKNFFLPGTLLWPITPKLRTQAAGFHVEPMAPSCVWALPLPAEGAANSFEQHPAWQALTHRTLCALLDGKMQREQDFLQLSAQQRYLQLCSQHPDWAAQIPLRHLASYLGVTDVTLSRLRASLRLNKG